jgi:serine/threonine protein kinase
MTQVGDLLAGRYTIERPIARGGMADVFLARDGQLDRQVAVKILFPEFARDPSFVERFRREAQNAAMLNHANIVSVYDYGQQHGTYFIVMEYVEGQSLRDILRGQGRLPAMQVARIGSEIAAGLDFAHRHGVVHRDIKPGNVLLTPQGEVKVADFGIAPNNSNLTRISMRSGPNRRRSGTPRRKPTGSIWQTKRQRKRWPGGRRSLIRQRKISRRARRVLPSQPANWSLRIRVTIVRSMASSGRLFWNCRNATPN